MTCPIHPSSNRFAAIYMAGTVAVAEMNQAAVQRWQKHQPVTGFHA